MPLNNLAARSPWTTLWSKSDGIVARHIQVWV